MTSIVDQALAAIETTPDLVGLTHAKILGAEIARLRADPDRYAGECLRSWQKDRGDCDVTIRGLDVTLRPKTWRLALALRLSALEAERERVLALHGDASCQAELRALREKLDAATKHIEQLAEQRDEALAQVEIERRVLSGARERSSKLEHERDALRDEISEAKEQLAKLTGAAYVHGPSLAQHIERISKWAESDHIAIGSATFVRAPQDGVLVAHQRMVGADRRSVDKSEPSAPRTLLDDIRDALNRHSAEKGSNTPDFLLAEFLLGCLAAWNRGVTSRAIWHATQPPDGT